MSKKNKNRDKTKLRIVELETESGWERIKFEELKTGDRFRMFNSTYEEPVVTDEGATVFTCLSDPYFGEFGPDGEGAWAVDCEE